MYTLPDNSVAGSVSFTKYLDISKDVVVSFDYACYGRDTAVNSGEGFCVFFSDTFNPYIRGGSPGPGLAYSSINNVDGVPVGIDTGGVTSGLLGVGFDITGNFGSNLFIDSGYADTIQNSIALRSNYSSKFDIITRTPNLNDQAFTKGIDLYQQLTTDNDIPIFKRVRVRLTDFGQRVVVDMKTVGDFNYTNYLDYTFTSYNNSLLSSTTLSAYPVAFTPAIKCNLGFSTGENVNTVFKIKNFNINGVFTLSASQGTYEYDIDTTTLSGIRTYTNPSAPYFLQYEQLQVLNNYDNHTTTNPTVTAGNPLIVAGTLGAPYVQGDIYIGITQHN